MMQVGVRSNGAAEVKDVLQTRSVSHFGFHGGTVQPEATIARLWESLSIRSIEVSETRGRPVIDGGTQNAASTVPQPQPLLRSEFRRNNRKGLVGPRRV
ncbi:unnamed protein product [Pylaiella littoralis]